MNQQKKSNNTNKPTDKEKEAGIKLLKEIANNMNAEIVNYTDINDAIKKGVSLGWLVDMEDVHSREDIEKFRQKAIGLF